MNPQKTDTESEALSGAINALMIGMGRGGLTYIAGSLGMSSSAMRKRLLSPVSFDSPTMRAVILLERNHDREFTDCRVHSEKRVGSYIIRVRNFKGERVPTWEALQPGAQAAVSEGVETPLRRQE
jgi:hypothetical protein